MNEMAELLKPTEAAVVSGVEVSAVNHAIDRDILPGRLIRKGRSRALSTEGCVYLAFYHGSAARLTAEERRYVIHSLCQRVEGEKHRSIWSALNNHSRFEHEFLSVDLTVFLDRTHERWSQYDAARDMVAQFDGILSGTPVIRGTRVPVYDVAASFDAGIAVEDILRAYPQLSEEHCRLASIYAKANPLQGRPTGASFLKDAKIVTRRVVEGPRTQS